VNGIRRKVICRSDDNVIAGLLDARLFFIFRLLHLKNTLPRARQLLVRLDVGLKWS